MLVRRYRALEPENRFVARGLETEWENRLRDLTVGQAELYRRQQQQAPSIGKVNDSAYVLASDLQQVWTAPTTTARDRKKLLRNLMAEAIIAVDPTEHRDHLTIRSRGDTLTHCQRL